MPKPVSSDLGLYYLNTALIAYNTPVLHSLVFSAYALPVFHRAEDFCTEKAVTLRLERTIVYRLRFLNLSIRPLPYFFRRGNFNSQRLKVGRIFRPLKNSIGFLCQAIPPYLFSPEALHQAQGSGVLLLIHGKTQERLAPESHRP